MSPKSCSETGKVNRHVNHTHKGELMIGQPHCLRLDAEKGNPSRFHNPIWIAASLLFLAACGDADSNTSNNPVDAGGDSVWQGGGPDTGQNQDVVGTDDMTAAEDGTVALDMATHDAADVVSDGLATLVFVVDDSKNKTFGDGEIKWTGSFSWDEATNTIVYSSSWLPTDGPFPPLYDDGPISQGGHEAEGAVANDHLFSTEVRYLADQDRIIEFGALNEFDNWIWVGPNGTVEIPQGSTERYELPWLTLPEHGPIDLKLVLDVAKLHSDFAGADPAKVFVKGTMNMWAPVQILDDGTGGDDAAGDGLYTYVHLNKLGPHDGGLNAGDEAQFVFVIGYGEGGAEEGIEYKVGGDAVVDGVSAWTDAAESGQWATVEVYLAQDSKGKTLNTAIRVPTAGNPPDPECTTDAECGDKVCEDGKCVESQVVLDPPVLFQLDPQSGSSSGGTIVLVIGENFVTGATVEFDGLPASDVVWFDGGTLSATTPAHPAGKVTVVVRNPDGQEGSFPLGFSYVDDAVAPTLTGISPVSGTVAGGTAVSVFGTGFQPGAVVTFGGNAADTEFVHAGELKAITPKADALGAVDVVVKNPDTQSAKLASAYTYTPDAIDWANLLMPIEPVVIVLGAETPVLMAEVYKGGVTDFPGQGPDIVCEAGFGPSGSNPETEPSEWKWVEANYSGDSGNNDVYSATLVPDEAGQFDWAFRFSVGGSGVWYVADLDGTVAAYSPAQSGSLEVKELPTKPTLYSMTPAGGAVTGGTSVTVTGALLETAVGVEIDGIAVSAVVNSTSVTFTTPKHDAKDVEVVVLFADNSKLTAPVPFRYGYILSPTMDGDVSNADWPSDYIVAITDTVTNWGESKNELVGNYLAFDNKNLYIALEGAVEATNSVVVYIDVDFGAATGPQNMTTLADNQGSLDDAISGIAVFSVPGFGAEFAAGSVGQTSFKEQSPLGDSGSAGWRKLSPVDNFAWLNGNVLWSTNQMELSIPLSTLFGGPVPVQGAKVAIGIRLGNQYGDSYSNQGLPDAVSGDKNEILNDVLLMDVFPY